MCLSEWFEEERILKLLSFPKYSTYPQYDPVTGLWRQCDHCQKLLFKRMLKNDLWICIYCGYNLTMSSKERIELLIDENSWIPINFNLLSYDILGFTHPNSYTEKLEEAQIRTGVTDAVQIGIGKIHGHSVAIAAMEFNFLGGSMGSVVGEKLSYLIEYALEKNLNLIIVCSSGGARMQEGTLSLMQMGKIAALLQVYQVQQRGLYVSILTYPTTGGVTASFGMLGDIIMAEPNAYIAFAGKRVIELTIGEIVPDGFQLAETLFTNGLLDFIVPRSILKGVLSELLFLYKVAPYKKPLNSIMNSCDSIYKLL